MTENNPITAQLRQLTLLLSLSITIAACATAPEVIPIDSVAEQFTVVNTTAQDITISLYAANKNDTERWEFYNDFAKKGYIPLQIEIKNPTPHMFSLGDTQYAICDPNYTRTRRTEAKDMALQQVEIMTEGKKKGFIFGWMKRKAAARKMKKEFKEIEFDTMQIPPESSLRGWLYFKMQEGKFTPAKLYKEYENYELEIAHIKNDDTNVVTNFYLPLGNFTKEFYE
jgi:hypothetical protein